MAKLLLVDPRRDACTAWRAALEARGHEVSAAPSGSIVLTMLERNRADVIVSHAVLEDMSGCELCAIVRTDPMTSEVRFLLLTENRKGAPGLVPMAHVDSMLSDDAPPACLVKRVEELLLEAALSGGSSRHSLNREGSGQAGEAGPAPDAIQGSLDVLDLCDVIQTVSDTRQRGWLLVRIRGVKGAIAFEAGRPVHAAFRGRTGNQAFTDLALATVGVRDATFEFLPSRDPHARALPSSMEGDVERLMLRVAARLDAAWRNAETAQAGDPRDAQA